MTEQSEGERLYILGHPVAHSKSPVMYNALYERLGLPWTYALADYACLLYTSELPTNREV